jgi:hypothetical protein
MLQQGQLHVANDIPKCFDHQNQQHHYATSKVAAKKSKITSKNIKQAVQHHTLHGDPRATNILNFLCNNIVGGGGGADLTCSADDDRAIDTVL